MQSDVIVTDCPAEYIHSARALLFGNSADPDQSSWLSTSGSAVLSFQGILVAVKGTRLLGAVYHESCGGHVGWLWPPALAEPSSATAQQIAKDLILAAFHRLARQGPRLIQVLLESSD